jgi:DMSO/TMAO reductase YedYZ molybdopterin-dependent catalytic subunit
MSADANREEPERRFGRGVFLGTVATGLTALAWGKPVWSKVSAAIAPAESLVPLIPRGWRIYTVSGTMPSFDEASWRLDVGGLVANPVSLSSHVAPNQDAHAVRFVSAEVPYVDYLTLQQASLHDVLLAYEMDGKPLPREHGAPLRLVIPEMYGYKNVKWLRQISFVPRTADGYWEALGYDRDAWVGRSNGYSS